MDKHAPISLGIELKVPNILLALKEVTDPYQLGTQLDIDTNHLKTFENNHPKCIDRQKIEVIKFWLNNKECSWKILADAVEHMDCHKRVVDSLNELHLRATNMQGEH